MRGLALLLIAITLDAWAQPAPPKEMAFEVASVKPFGEGYKSAGYSIDAGDSYRFTGGRFSAAFPVLSFISFAWKLTLSPDQRREILSHVPKWVGTESYLIEARAPTSHPTKDEVRLMMRSLLAERFGVALHFESRTTPVLALMLVKGKPGPALRPHSEGPVCPDIASPDFVGKNVEGVFPLLCGVYGLDAAANGIRRLGARNTTIELLAAMIPNFGNLGMNRPVVDRTGLTGSFDFTIDFAPESPGPPPSLDSPTDPAGPSLIDALREQLGLKLEPSKAELPTLVIDRVERPTEN